MVRGGERIVQIEKAFSDYLPPPPSTINQSEMPASSHKEETPGVWMMDPEKPPRENEQNPWKSATTLVNTGHSREDTHEEFSNSQNPPIKYVCESCGTKSYCSDDARKNPRMEYSTKENDDEDEEKESPPKTSRKGTKWRIFRRSAMKRINKRRVLRKTSNIIRKMRRSPQKAPKQ